MNASFGLYGRTGFDEKFLGQVILDYAAVLSSQLIDLQDFNEFLMSESATWLGGFVTFTGGSIAPT